MHRITDEISKDIGFEKEELKVLFDNLDNKSSIVVDENKNVNFIYPVSAIPTNHKVTLADGRSFNYFISCQNDFYSIRFIKNNSPYDMVEVISNTPNIDRAIFIYSPYIIIDYVKSPSFKKNLFLKSSESK